jgi:anti-sigma B factor antagonist
VPWTRRAFTYEIEREGVVLTVYLMGELDSFVVGLNEAIVEAMDEWAQAVVLDAADLSFCDSMGLRQILLVRHRALGIGATFHVHRAHGLFRDVVRAAGLTEVLALTG